MDRIQSSSLKQLELGGLIPVILLSVSQPISPLGIYLSYISSLRVLYNIFGPCHPLSSTPPRLMQIMQICLFFVCLFLTHPDKFVLPIYFWPCAFLLELCPPYQGLHSEISPPLLAAMDCQSVLVKGVIFVPTSTLHARTGSGLGSHEFGENR